MPLRVHQILVLLAVIVGGGIGGAIFARALGGKAGGDDAARFTAHMLMEFARMSVDDVRGRVERKQEGDE